MNRMYLTSDDGAPMSGGSRPGWLRITRSASCHDTAGDISRVSGSTPSRSACSLTSRPAYAA